MMKLSNILLLVNVAVAIFIPTIPAQAQPLINEFMASNTTTIQDEDGDYPDWIEIYNPGDTPIDLTGYGLSDRPDNPYKWIIPNYTLYPKQHLLVFASGKDKNPVPIHWETVVIQGDVWQYFIGTSEPPENWSSDEFDDSGWQSGPSSIGSTNYNETIIPNTISLYIRRKFNIEYIAEIAQCLLQIDFQDAFVAYLNGHEIARANIGEAGFPPPFDEKVTSTRSPSMLFGGDPEVFKIDNIKNILLPGENVLAIQVHRHWLSPSISIIPFLTFGMNILPSNPQGVPDNLKFSVIYPHTNFKISSDGETLVLTDPDGVLCDSVYTRVDDTDISMGRKPNGGEEWVLFFEPTPGESNTTEGYQGYTDAVVEMSLPGGFYNSGISVELTTYSHTAVIRYTLDGSEPSKNSNLYTSVISVDTTTVIRARVYEYGLYGKINTQTYFINSQSTLPVISLSTNPDNLFDGVNGIYVNANEDWERPIHMEFYESDGSPGFSIDAGVKISGLLIRMFVQKSLAIFARNKYGSGKINYQTFPDLPITEFKSFTLRNSGNELLNTRFIDALCQSMVKDINLDIQAYRPAVVFINSVYWGIYNIREKQNEDYLASHHGVDPDNIDELDLHTSSIEVIEGDVEHYTAMIDYLENHDMSNSANFEYIKTQMDVDNFIDYNVTEIFFANTNWPSHNVKFWRPRTPEGRWRWLLCDLDWGMRYRFQNMFDFLTEKSCLYAPLFFKLLENDVVIHNFINRFADYTNTIFKPDFVIQRIHEMKKVIEPEMPIHISRWKEFQYHDDEKIESMDQWYRNIQQMEEFAEQRPDIMRNHIIEHFGLSGTANVNLNVSSPEAGKIKINSIVPDDFPWEGIYFKDVPIQLTAFPNLGYRFVGWTGITLGDSLSATITLTDSISVTAVFEKITGNNVVIEQSQSPYTIASIQTVSPGASLTIEPGVELMMARNTSIHVTGEIHMNGTPDNPILISPENGNDWSGIHIDNASGSSTISNVIISGASSWNNPEDFPAAISSLNSNVTIDNVRFEDNQQCIFANGGTVTVRNCQFMETNRHEPINIKNAEALVENCRFVDVFIEDAIDYDGIHDGIIRNNEIFGTVDSDSDGIDIGDDCMNVLICDNLIYDCTDKGISIGEGSKDIRVERNIIAGCLYGIAVKDSATAFIDHNTLYDNDYAVAAYEKGGRRFGGGTAVVTNSILTKSNTSTLFTDELSTITASYTLSDTELLTGEGNIMADPLLASPENRIFSLLPGSPAINAGNPQSPLDPDGSRSDMGALVYTEAVSNIVINEINYNSSNDFNPGDWVELYNTAESSVDLSGWVFKDEDDAHVFECPAGTIIPSDGYLVLCNDAVSFHNLFPDVDNYTGSFDFGLSGQGELIRLYDVNGALIDWLNYDDTEPWPIEPDGNGPTLALLNPIRDNSLPEYWASSGGHGTPGEKNDVYSGVDEDAETDVPIAFSLGQNYPNPFNSVTTIPFSVPMAGRVTIEVYSILGQKVAKILDDNITSGYHQVVFKSENLPSGLYIYIIKAGNYNKAKQMVLMK